MACYCKRKGKQFEKSVAEDIRQTIDMGDMDVQPSRGGQTEPDVYLSEEAKRRYPYHTECKNQKTLRIPQWIKQSEEECCGLVPTVVFKLHGGQKKYIVVPFQEWLRLHEYKK